ncbi:MAG TPA: M20 family metallopeptidase [Acidimicrobiales bacterium]|jgi:amidohydrolase|nr:M20 family metallopeptidase [Acidimicrobiales bacterium]
MDGPRSDLSDVKARLAAEVDRRRGLLVDVSHQIHAQPELGYEERFAHDLLTRVLEEEGLGVTRSARGMDTAFEAHAGSTGPTVAVLCEYDALPGIGHACGHNVIAAAGLGAGLAAAALAEELGGRVAVVGSPAEEGGGGKLHLIDAGAFKGVDAALMVHPADADLAAMDVIAVHEVVVTYTGEAAHAAAFPHRGRNALDAAVLGYVNVAALRQHIAPGERIHGIISHGGDKPNIVPARAQSEWMVRSPTLAGLDRLKQRFVACLEAGAEAAGCEIDIGWRDVVYADMVDNQAIVERYRANAEALGRMVRSPSTTRRVVGSTDMGNVSYEVPAIHPMIQVAPPGVPIHTPAFAGFAGGPEGDQAVVDGAKALAFTVADLWLDEGLVDLARAEWEASVNVRRS